MQQIKLDKNVTIEFTPEQMVIVLDIITNAAYPYVKISPIINSIETQLFKQTMPVIDKPESNHLKKAE